MLPLETSISCSTPLEDGVLVITPPMASVLPFGENWIELMPSAVVLKVLSSSPEAASQISTIARGWVEKVSSFPQTARILPFGEKATQPTELLGPVVTALMSDR